MMNLRSNLRSPIVSFFKSRNDRSTRALQRAAAVTVESLERREMFSATVPVGDLNGTATFEGGITALEPKNVYSFSMAHNGQLNVEVGEIGVPLDLLLVQEKTDSNGSVRDIIIASQTATPVNGGLLANLPQVSLAAGDYSVIIRGQGGDAAYSVRMTSDYAGQSLVQARNIGSATDATFRDFIGRSSETSKNDAFDLYKFKMDAPGALFVKLDVDGTPGQMPLGRVQLIQDANGNGVVDDGDLLETTSPGPSASMRPRLEAGTYFIRVISDVGFSNYKLRVNADYAGGLAINSRVMGSLDSIKSFNDFIDKDEDVEDRYLFNVSAARPLFLSLVESGGGSSRLSLFKDANNDGMPQESELEVTATAKPATRFLRTVGPGQYIVQMKALTGGGTYTLTAETRPDAAGDTLKTAKNLGTVNGLIRADDSVTIADPFDFYKFTASAAGKVSAQLFCEFEPATVDLIRDANNNGVVDPGEVLASSTPSAMGLEQLSKSITGGTYFLRVKITDSTIASKYLLTFHTDYAGSTPQDARTVGALRGTKDFDDWASGDLGGISDSTDLYKFSLSSTRTFSAKMIGAHSGQDLDLELYRDKNNDGVLSSTELVTSSRKVDSPNEQISKSLAAGTYYLKVVGVNGETNYHLSLKA
jgi:hypothetical protein